MTLIGNTIAVNHLSFKKYMVFVNVDFPQKVSYISYKAHEQEQLCETFNCKLCKKTIDIVNIFMCKAKVINGNSFYLLVQLCKK